MAGEIIATGIVLSIDDAAATPVYTIIPGVQGVPSFPALTLPDIDVTALDSLANEFLLGLGDPGTFEFTLNLRKKTTGAGWIAAQQALEGYVNDGKLHMVKLEVKAGGTTLRTYTVAGLIKLFQLQGGSANVAVTAKVLVRLSGAITVV